MSRRVIINIIILVVCLGLLTGVIWACWPAIQTQMYAWTGEENTTEQIKGSLSLAWIKFTRSEPDTDPFTPVAYSGVYPYGVNTFFEQEVELAKIEESMALLADAGITWIRQEFPWEDIEISGKGDYWDHKWDHSAWDKYDLIVETAEKYGIQIIARLDNPPVWSRSTEDTPEWSKGPPDDYADYGDFVYAVVSRYASRISYYQLWNEPNIYPEWGDQAVDPAAYTELLKVGYRRAKEADPDCVILAAGLAQTTETGGSNMSDLMFLQSMYDAGALGYFDIMGAQVYGLWTGPTDQRVSEENANFQRVTLLREIMVENGDSSTPIWATEIGWNAIPENFEAAPIYGRVTEEKQAEYTVTAYTLAQEQWPWMGVMNYWFFRRPSDAEQDQAWYYFRMVEPDFTTLPVYTAIAELTQLTPTLAEGFHNENDWGLDYSDGWKVAEDDEAIFGECIQAYAPETLTFTFSGNRFGLVMLPSTGDVLLDVTVDGEPVEFMTAQKTDSYTGTHLRLRDRLSSSEHTATITVVSGRAEIDGVLIFDQGDPHWLEAGIIIVLALATLAAICLKNRRKGNCDLT